MKLQIKYFAGLRERFGTAEETIEIDAHAPTVADLWRALEGAHPEIGRMKKFVRVAVNRDFADETTRLAADDEIALIPPVSGGAGEEPRSEDEPTELEDPTGAFRITLEALDTDRVRTHVTRPEAGAIVLFEGVVRDHTGDHDVSHLEYETYLEMTLDKLVQTGEEVAEKWEQCQIAIHHRYGRLEIGEKAVVIAVSSPHRAAAFEACQYAIDRLKEIVPIWKKEVGPDGAEWIGMGP
ncbi:molybdopterin converting factor subunit 1 [Persicimonas caeni]|nr:molybdopterin converting factor subunit 1 [Persicimonas caeni]